MIPKYRAWIKTSNQMGIPTSIEFDEGDVDYICFDYEEVGYSPKTVTLMQSTGLSDKNGVEIFEGDVVEWSTISGRKRGVGKIKHGGHVFLISSGKEVDHMNGSYSYNILGNIYEHPDLAEG